MSLGAVGSQKSVDYPGGGDATCGYLLGPLGCGQGPRVFLPAFHERRPHLVEPVRVDPAGVHGPPRGRARGPDWRTTSRGLVVPVSVERTPEQRIVEAAALLREGEAVTGWAALHWEGGTWFDGTVDGSRPRDVPLVTSREVVTQAGLSLSQEFLAPYDIRVVDGLPITSRARSVVFEMRYAAGLGAAVEALDMACFSDLVSITEVAELIAALGPVTGIQRARDALVEADENSWSPRESAMRGLWTRQAGLTRPLCNAPVFDLDGQHLGTADLIDPVLGLAGEYNGLIHVTSTRIAKDLRREAAFREVGIEPVTMVASDWRDTDDFTRRLLQARDRVLARTAPRRWTLDPPGWWTPTATVAQRRALDARQRERFLGYRLPG